MYIGFKAADNKQSRENIIRFAIKHQLEVRFINNGNNGLFILAAPQTDSLSARGKTIDELKKKLNQNLDMPLLDLELFGFETWENADLLFEPN